MRIAMLSYHTSPIAALGGKHTGGMNVYVRELSRALGQLGHEVDIFTRRTGREEGEVVAQLEENVRLIPLPAGPPQPLDIHALAEHIPEFAKSLLDFSEESGHRYTLVHSHYWMSALAGLELKAAWGLPMILMMHTLGLVKHRIQALGEAESAARIRSERRALAAADRIIAATPAERADLQWLYEVPSARIRVISPGVDLELFRPMPKEQARAALGIAEDAQIVLYVGRFDAVKGVDTLVVAAQKLIAGGGKLGERLLLHVIGGDEDDVPGTGDEGSQLKHLASKAGLAGQIQFLGPRRQRALPTHYAAADVVVMPSRSESFGLVALEAMACGIPVIASRVGGLAHLVQDGLTGYQVPEGDAGALARRLGALLADGEARRRMGAAARQFAESYSWAGVAERVADVYEELTVRDC